MFTEPGIDNGEMKTGSATLINGTMLTTPADRAEGLRAAAVLGLLVAAATAVHVIEGLVMLPLGPFRLGLANAVVITALYRLGGKYGVFVSVSRAVVGAAALGVLFSPVFPMNFGGALASAAVMAALVSISGRRLDPIIVSLVGAAFHNAVQLAYVSLLVGTADVFYLALPVGAWTVVSGVVVGIVSRVLVVRFPATTAVFGRPR
jgi:heptaprenyl diphosphate synthase